MELARDEKEYITFSVFTSTPTFAVALNSVAMDRGIVLKWGATSSTSAYIRVVKIEGSGTWDTYATYIACG